MSNSEASIAMSTTPRPGGVWKIVAAVALALAAVPVVLGVGAWAAGQLSEGSPATPSRATVSTAVRSSG